MDSVVETFLAGTPCQIMGVAPAMMVHPTSIDLFTHGWQLSQTFSAGYGHVSIMTLQGYSFRVVSETGWADVFFSPASPAVLIAMLGSAGIYAFRMMAWSHPHRETFCMCSKARSLATRVRGGLLAA